MTYERHQGRPVHGGLNLLELDTLGLSPSDIIDFSTSINPLGPSPKALDAIRHLGLASYPDPDCTELRRAISEYTGVGTNRIVVGNGSTELIHLIARAFLSTGDSAVVFAPTFSEYAAACRLQKVEPLSIRARVGSFDWDLSEACEEIGRMRPGVVFLCNPNNPTGVYLSENEVRTIAEAVGDTGLLVLDEAYVPFVDRRWDSLCLLTLDNVVLMRSMTKDHALTGLRLGYMLSTLEVANQVRRFQYSWSVNSVAQAAGVVALADPGHVTLGREAVRQGKEFVRGAAGGLNVDCPPSAANFLLMDVGDAEQMRSELLVEYSVCVRDCTSFGLPEYIRVGVRTEDENQVLVEALGRVLSRRRGERDTR